MDSFQMTEAIKHFSASLNVLGNIKFYQALKGEALIDLREYADLRRSTYLNLAKCRVEETRSLRRPARPQAYLS
jgi:hypothetical protein